MTLIVTVNGPKTIWGNASEIGSRHLRRGLQRICLAIRATPEKAFEYAYAGRAVAIVTESSAGGIFRQGPSGALRRRIFRGTWASWPINPATITPRGVSPLNQPRHPGCARARISARARAEPRARFIAAVSRSRTPRPPVALTSA
jgi:hypothetical protein